ncbi:hypothetical protein SKAU_G00096130 [Synaphobranchus kaupii]|uniref:Uncharacterized protein n=1 Tax=Synaphobranchus kaupii TaxID=118154 RepID=A0A9Q1J4U2_SYNKA|nr:hypothetical protein SKAU_G00096130 [Synaphobranchus kaupii]
MGQKEWSNLFSFSLPRGRINHMGNRAIAQGPTTSKGPMEGSEGINKISGYRFINLPAGAIALYPLPAASVDEEASNSSPPAEEADAAPRNVSLDIETLSSCLSRRIEAYTDVCDLFGVLFERDCDVRDRAAKLSSTYATDLDSSLADELIQFKHFVQKIEASISGRKTLHTAPNVTVEGQLGVMADTSLKPSETVWNLPNVEPMSSRPLNLVQGIMLQNSTMPELGHPVYAM